MAKRVDIHMVNPSTPVTVASLDRGRHVTATCGREFHVQGVRRMFSPSLGTPVLRVKVNFQQGSLFWHKMRDLSLDLVGVVHGDGSTTFEENPL